MPPPLDTNVIIRDLTQDEPQLSQRAHAFLKRVEVPSICMQPRRLWILWTRCWWSLPSGSARLWSSRLTRTSTTSRAFGARSRSKIGVTCVALRATREPDARGRQQCRPRLLCNDQGYPPLASRRPARRRVGHAVPVSGWNLL